MIQLTITTKWRVYRWHCTFADAAYAVGGIVCMAATGVILAWRG